MSDDKECVWIVAVANSVGGEDLLAFHCPEDAGKYAAEKAMARKVRIHEIPFCGGGLTSPDKQALRVNAGEWRA